MTAEAAFPTDITARLVGALTRATDAFDVTVAAMTGFALTPAVPVSAYIGTPPAVLTIGSIYLVPV